MARILVTGGAGYIGSTLVGRLLKEDHQVTVLDNLMYGQDCLLPYFHSKNFRFITGDVRNYDLLKSLTEEAEVVFPLAAIVGMPACDKDKELATKVNYNHVASICQCLKPHQKLIFPQTNSGYGLGQGESFCTEETPLNPISHYGITKCRAESAVLAIGGASFRLATVFGASPRMRLDLLVNDFVYKAVKDGYIVLFEMDFKRNYIHVSDVVGAFCFAMHNYNLVRGQVFNLGLSTANLSKWELCQKIKKFVPNFSIQVDEISKDPDQRNYIVSNDKIEKLGWKPEVSLEEGIQELIQAYKVIPHPAPKYFNI